MQQSLESLQIERLKSLLSEVIPHNRFYTAKFAEVDLESLQSIADLGKLPVTTKSELLADQQTHPPYGTNLTYPLDRYCRPYQTSGTTTGRPLRWLETPQSWQWTLDCWKEIYRIVRIEKGIDRLFFPFSFGPFLGFWTAWEAATQEGYWCIPGGGMSSAARLRVLSDHGATVLLCTPTYAIHLAEVATQEGMNLASGSVRALIVAGEPGGSIPSTRSCIEKAWGARVFDHSGMTEIGPTAVECPENPAGLHILESEYLAEVVDPESLQPVEPGTEGELILTNLGRLGSPLIRYRTGDLVCVDPEPCPCGRRTKRLKGGILGRADDMIHLRGNNVHPSALEAILRRFAEVAEFRLELDQRPALAKLCIEIEVCENCDGEDLTKRVDQSIRDELLFRAEIKIVAPGTLPRYEMKAKRFSRRK